MFRLWGNLCPLSLSENCFPLFSPASFFDTLPDRLNLGQKYLYTCACQNFVSSHVPV